MKISIIGYGKMGKEVAKLAQERGHEIVKIFDIDNLNEINKENLKKSDVVFEFTKPEAAFENIMKCIEAGVPCISGTTGWIDKLDYVKQICEKESKTFFYASNFSIGVNIFYKINKFLAQIMNKYSNYDIEVAETHHIHKLDAPSGTAIQIANQIIENIERKNNWKLNNGNSDDLIIKAFREGEIPGIHSVKYESEVDFLEITHSSKNRRGLAFGAVLAAEFLKGKTGFYTMDNLLSF